MMSTDRSALKRWLDKYNVKDYNNPESFYDYDSAFRHGVKPTLWDSLPEQDKAEDISQNRGDLRGKYMFPDEYKKKGHPFPPKK